MKKHHPPLSARYLDIEEVCEKLGMSNSAVYRAIRTGVLPKPTKINARVARWPESQIDRAMKKLSGAPT